MVWAMYRLKNKGATNLSKSYQTISFRWADNFSAQGCGGSLAHPFQHPFLQVIGVFIWKLSISSALIIQGCKRHGSLSDNQVCPQKGVHLLLFLPPPLYLLTMKGLLVCALNMTSASSFQMLRGAVIIFTGLLSVAFLGRRLAASQWIGISLTIVGLIVVGLADFVSGHNQGRHKTSEVITGDLLIIMAQIIVAIQMVLEEKFVAKHDVHPLRAVGTEGFFGFFILTLLLIPMYFIPVGSFSGNPRGVLEDALDAFCQIGNQPLIIVALLGNILSIAFFNFAGISVTKEISATTRMVLDSLRTVLIWIVSLGVGWEMFHSLQVLGFIILLLGTALYNGLHKPLLAKIPWCYRFQSDSMERESLLSDGKGSVNEYS
uniref:Solute carrier family 35 member F6 n=1 Tax=Latimeria chalumnae TaxID=7897 RepID=H3AJA5_LATCH